MNEQCSRHRVDIVHSFVDLLRIIVDMSFKRKVVFELIVVVVLLPCRHVSEEILRESICLLIGLVTGNTDIKVIMRLP